VPGCLGAWVPGQDLDRPAAAEKNGRANASRRFDVIIDANLDYPGARAAAREWILQTLAYLIGESHQTARAGTLLPGGRPCGPDARHSKHLVPIHNMTVPFPYFPIKIDKNIRVRAPGDKNLRTFLKDPASKVSDLIVISHGCKAGRRFAVIGVLLPSNKYAEQALIPGNAAGTGDNVDMKALSLQLDNLKGSFNAANEAATVKAMKVASTSAEGQRQRLRGVCEVGPLPGETRDPRPGGRQQPLLQRSAPQGFPATDQAGVLHHHPAATGGSGAAAGLRGIAKDHPALRLHLVGHSFGGRLVTATSAAVSAATILRANSMSLLQAAFSHYGFARNWDQRNNDGFFRRVVDQKAIRGPAASAAMVP
jgi:hypothetical protein